MAVYAFDGTWNVRDLKEAILTVQPSQYGADRSFRRDTVETNVHRFREFVGAAQCEYLEGIGTRFSTLGRIFGGAFGAGAKWRVRTMYRRLCKRYHSGDKNDRLIDIVGFSRGAATAVHFAHVIAERGIPRPDGPKHVAWHYDPLLGWSFRMPKAVRPPEGSEPPIRFLGLFDTVASMGLPIGPFRNRPTARWKVTTIPDSVQHSFHAMALDEVRPTFALIRPARTDDQTDLHYELWFRGVHSNIGGGYPDRGLSDIVLTWMMEMYLWTLDQECEVIEVRRAFSDALEQLQPKLPKVVASKLAQPEGETTTAPASEPPRTASVESPPAVNAENPAADEDKSLETLEPNPDGELGRPSDMRRQAWRAMPANALVHHSVFRRTKNLLLDHHRANRRLLRPIPGDAQSVYDPPYFNMPTPRDEARAIAEEAFFRLPVRAAAWLVVRGKPVVRSDDWFGEGERRRCVESALSRDFFLETCTEWLLNACPPAADLGVPATEEKYFKKNVAVGLDEVQWTIDVVTALEPFVPRLRELRARSARARPSG